MATASVDISPSSFLSPAGSGFVSSLPFFFAAVESGLAQRGRALGEASLEEMDALWDAAKSDPTR